MLFNSSLTIQFKSIEIIIYKFSDYDLKIKQLSIYLNFLIEVYWKFIFENKVTKIPTAYFFY